MNYPNLDFLGEKLDKVMAKQICTGEIDPETKQSYNEMEGGKMKVYQRREKKEKKTKEKKATPKKKVNSLHSFFKTKETKS